MFYVSLPDLDLPQNNREQSFMHKLLGLFLL